MPHLHQQLHIRHGSAVADCCRGAALVQLSYAADPRCQSLLPAVRFQQAGRQVQALETAACVGRVTLLCLQQLSCLPARPDQQWLPSSFLITTPSAYLSGAWCGMLPSACSFAPAASLPRALSCRLSSVGSDCTAAGSSNTCTGQETAAATSATCAPHRPALAYALHSIRSCQRLKDLTQQAQVTALFCGHTCGQ